MEELSKHCCAVSPPTNCPDRGFVPSRMAGGNAHKPGCLGVYTAGKWGFWVYRASMHVGEKNVEVP